MIETVRYPSLLAILLGGLAAGTIDIGAAALINFVSPIRVLYFIAGGILGRSALAGGPSIALLGLGLQWLMSLIIAGLYVIATRRLPVRRRRWIVDGLAYGVVIFFVMNYVVVPFSAWGKSPTLTADKFAENMVAMLLFGLVVTYFAQHYASAARVPRSS
jgi:hypothetical protein